MNPTHASTAEVKLPYEVDNDPPGLRQKANRLVEAHYEHGDSEREPLIGTTVRSMSAAIAGKVGGVSNEPLFGNRFRWVMRTFREALDRRRQGD